MAVYTWHECSSCHDTTNFTIQCDIRQTKSRCTNGYAGVDEHPLFGPETIVPIQMNLSYALSPYGGDVTPQYWCSERCNEQKVTDMLVFGLVHPVCLVKEVQIEPYIEYPEASILDACACKCKG